MRPIPSSPFPMLCGRPGCEEWMVEELRARHGHHARVLSPGRIQLDAPPPSTPTLFEWQRLPHARFYPLDPSQRPPDNLVESFWSFFRPTPLPWAAQVFPGTHPESPSPARLQAILRDLVRAGKRLHPDLERWQRKPAKLFRTSEGRILQLSGLRKGIVYSADPPEFTTSDAPGGEIRMKMDPGAPSRSFLKVEEAFVRMNRSPQAGETVIDLGAAPGGWSYAFAKRGCRVTAVDNGPLKISDARIRRIEHVHADGLTFRLSRHQPPVDWLVGDMLIPPGQAFGLLKTWAGGAQCRNLVMNIKLPQKHPLPALVPILDWLESHPGLRIRQLWHDRREVTVFGPVTPS